VAINKGGTILVQTADSAAVTGAVSTIQAFATPQYTLPASFLQVGDRLRIKCRAVLTGKNATETLVITLILGTVTLAANAATNLANADEVFFDLEYAITVIGTSGKIQGGGLNTFGTPGTATARAISLSSTTLNTTLVGLITASATWSGSSATNTVVCRDFSIELAR